MNADRWRLLVDDGASAACGLALDEALMVRHHRGAPQQPPTLRLYTYRTHCALVGRYQNLEAEVDLAACARTGTEVGRRPTGGGAIVMGADQLGVALTMRTPADRRPKQLIEELSRGVVAGLAELGVDATFRGKNDLEVDGRKVAGLGLYVDDAGALLFHASVLADLDVPFMLQVLRIPAAKLADKAVAAVEQRVTTLTRATGRRHDAAALREVVALGFTKAFGVELDEDVPSADELLQADRLVADRHSTDDWLRQRGRIADGSGSTSLKTPAGLVRLYVTTHGDLVKSAVFAGDFTELPSALARLESSLRWQRLSSAAVTAAVTKAGAHEALEVPAQRVVDAVLDAGARAVIRAEALPVRGVGSCYFPGQD